MEKHKTYLQSVADENSALTDEINQLAAHSQTQPNEEVNAAVKQCLLKLYESIVRMSNHRGHPRTPRLRILNAWESFLKPIKALSLLPFGDFLTARMLLYLCSGLSSQQALDMKFPEARAYSVDVPLNQIDIALDDALLDSLRSMWTKSDRYEEFDWVFGECEVRHWRAEDRSSERAQRCHQIVQALTPVELVALGGNRGRYCTFAKKSDVGMEDEEGWQPFLGSVPGDHYERTRSSVHIPDDEEVMTDEWVFKMTGWDGPIRDSFCYSIKETDTTSTRDLPLFPRSLQFILDARRIAQPLTASKRRILAEKGLSKAGIPPEMRAMILSHLDLPVRHPYLSSVDIAEAYAPFPERHRSCTECSRSKKVVSTCPVRSIYVWNIPLRTFFVFHPSRTSGASLCRYGAKCEGHHDNGDGWKIVREKELNAFVERIVKERHGSTTTLADVGFAPPTDFTLDGEEEDQKRRHRLFNSYGPLGDSSNELRMNGALFGLTSSMVHNKLLIGSWQGESTSGSCTTDAQWAVARCLADNECAQRALKQMHSRCHRC